MKRIKIATSPIFCEIHLLLFMSSLEKTVAFDSTVALVQSLRSSDYLYLILYKNYRMRKL